jgi:arginase family enzyme
VDGHLDLYDHNSSPTGEAADMPVAAVLGIGEPGLLASMSAPVAKPEHLAVLGVHDPDEWPVVSNIVEELDLHVVEPPDIARRTRDVAAAAVGRAGSAGSFWLHLDVDAFDETEFPATDYPMPNGLTLDVGLELLRAVGADERLVGVSVGCYNPEKDTDSKNGREVVRLLMAATGQ